jgi:hypothetical protein
MLTTVAVFRDPWQAQVLLSRLDAEGLLAFAQHYHQISARWSYSYALGGVQVQVADCDVEDAREIIRLQRDGVYRADLLERFGDLDEPCCPKCGGQDFRRRATAIQIIFSFLVLFLTGVLVPPVLERRCRTCGALWKAPVASPSTN